MNREVWKTMPFKSDSMFGQITITNNTLTVSGTVHKLGHSNKVLYWAADSQLLNYSSEGDNLPFYNEEQAFCRKENIGEASIENNTFSFKITMPNSYYKQLGSVYIPPIVQMALNKDKDTLFNVKLSDGFPYRFLSHPAVKSYASNVDKLYCPSSPYFYNNILDLPSRSQNTILCSSQYPDKNTMPKNFWGDKPSL
jgi:hypothetical protein